MPSRVSLVNSKLVGETPRVGPWQTNVTNNTVTIIEVLLYLGVLVFRIVIFKVNVRR